jgi:ubiquinone/menaquinone biosynthesis C-methylase UbiE
MDRKDMYFDALVAAFVRGKLATDNRPGSAHDRLWQRPLEGLSSDDVDQLVRLGKEAGLRLHKFKRTMELPRVRRVLGVLKGLGPTNLLDVGSGRGTFLWPLLDSFPHLPILAIDHDARRVADIAAVRDGGIATLDVRQMDATALALDDGAFDVVTMLEVLEHIPTAQRALAEAVRVARRFVVVSVPSTPDNNPEHIHLFTGRELTAMVERAGAVRVSVAYVLNHMIAVARVTDR